MKRLVMPMFRYGEADWDADYMKWGLHDEATQIEEAESVLRLVGKRKPLRILDLACGIGRHAVHYAKHGHQVTGLDISETFIGEARKLAREMGVNVSFEFGDIRKLAYRDCFDVVTFIEKAYNDEAIVRAIYDCLVKRGLFIQDMRNPEHPRTKAVTGDWEKWHEEGGVFHLERHWNTDDGIHHDLWIEINPSVGKIIERTNECQAGAPHDVQNWLRDAGFRNLEWRTMSGEPFTEGPEPRWLWLVARK